MSNNGNGNMVPGTIEVSDDHLQVGTYSDRTVSVSDNSYSILHGNSVAHQREMPILSPKSLNGDKYFEENYE